MGRVYEKWHICKCLVFHAENLVKVYTQKNSGYTKSRRKIRQQKIPKINSKFLHIEVLSREAWASKDTRFLTLSWDCLSPVCQGAKFGINRQPLSFYFIIPYFLNAAISCFSQLLNGFQIFFLNKGKSLCLIAFIFCFRFFHHLYMTDFPCMVQYLFTHRSKNVIQLLHIIAHIHGPVTDGLTSAKSK